MEASQVRVHIGRMATAEDRAGNQAVFALFRFPHQQFVDVSTQQRLHQARICSLRSADGDYPFSAELTRSKELTDGDDVLIVKVPDLFRQADWLKEMDVRPDQPRRMRARKFIKRDLPLRMPARLAAAGLANVHFSGREAG